MVDPLQFNNLGNIGSLAGRQVEKGDAGPAPVGPDFKSLLMSSLEEVNRLQQEASSGVEKLVTGESENVAEVFAAVRKADIAFSMLMEIRNKLTDAYQEIQQMRI